jgi:la-related protein 1
VNRFLAGASRLSSPRSASRNGTASNAVTDTPGIFWIKDKDSPSHELPAETTSDLYLAARDRAITARSFHPCPHDMNVMYQFWEHFLVRNFNSRMYMEFRTFAMDDASARNEFHGLNSLLKYYGKALSFHEVPIRRNVAADYVNLVRSEQQNSDRPAFKQLRAAWRDGALNMKNRKRVKDFLDPGMEEELDR